MPSHINCALTISSGEAALLWDHSTPMPRRLKASEKPFRDHQTRRSANGLWVVRLTSKLAEQSAEDTCDLVQAEYARLQIIGQDVISRALVPNGEFDNESIDDIIVVSPWLDGLVACTQELYDTAVDKHYDTYFTGPQGDRLYKLWGDIRAAGQHSCLGDMSKPFLHDTDGVLVPVYK